MIVSGPSWLIAARRELSNPRISDVIRTIDVIPMTTPSTVSAERILLVRSVSNAIAKISENNPLRIVAMVLLSSQRFDRFITPQMLFAYMGLPVKTVEDLINVARAKPGALNCASPG